ncbi:hypothetical protein HNY73_022983 [Argiope bruennichi]|uniref:Uncharacterized protein n=1 Tax=Argiope bruennichi TaxID=94029 RepID=A0A8T0E6C6_ARGBR|nr:hypothetical protein HNY73_022983 [Argiope bruennichi]
MAHQDTSFRLPCVLQKSQDYVKRRESFVDDPRPGQGNTDITADLIDKVDDLVRSDRCVTLQMLAVKVDASVGTVGQLFTTGCVIGRCEQ